MFRIFIILIFLYKVIGIKIIQPVKLGEFCKISETEKGICKSYSECHIGKEVHCDINSSICGVNSKDFIPNVCCPLKPGDISKKKCEEYKREFRKLGYTIPGCDAHKTLVYGGEPTRYHEFPHQALLGFKVEGPEKYRWECGGSLISDRFVLSAAHCEHTTKNVDVSIVRLGEYDFSKEYNPNRRDYEIEDLIVSPNYTTVSKYHDIMLIKLKKKVEFNKFIRPACLHTTFDIQKPKYFEHLNFIATGWGITETGDQSTILLKVEIQQFSNSECCKIYGTSARFYSQSILEKIQICAGGRNKAKDTCTGDSGGPIQIYNNKDPCITYDIVGITSFGKVCGAENIPAVYTRVSAYIEWIEKVVFDF